MEQTYKRIVATNAGAELKVALGVYPDITVRPAKTQMALNSLLTEYVIEGELRRKGVIDKAVELFDCEVE